MRAAWAGAVLVVGAVQLAAGWSGVGAVLVFVGAVVATFGLVSAATAARVAPAFTVLGVVTVAVVGTYFVAAPSSGPLAAVLDSVPRLLTAPRPAPVTLELLVPGLLLVVVVALVAALSSGLVVPAVGGCVLYVAGALLTAGTGDRRGFGALALLLVIGLGWVLVGRPRRRVVPAALVTLLAAGALVASLLPTAKPFEPRDLVTPPVSPLPVASPLPELASWAASDVELFRVRGPDVPLRLVALDDFTGAAWRASTTYGPLGVVAPATLPAGARQVTAEVEVTVGGLDGPWLPAPGRPTGLSLDDAVLDPETGSLVLPSGATAGLSYTVRSTVDSPDDVDLRSATVPGDARRQLALPGLPYSLAEYARRTVVDARTPFEKAVAIEDVVRTGRQPDATAPVGSSYARLETFLFGTPGTAGARSGTAEQFASAFAVLGRAVGLPTRVVVGFRPVPPQDDGYAIVRGSDATAWPEVYFTGWGWVPFDPVTGTDTGPGSATRREVINRLATATPTPTEPATTAPEAPLPAPDAAAPPTPPAGTPWQLLVAAVPLLAVGLLGGLRAARRFRLRRAGALGAWAYVLDSLLLAGRAPGRTTTAPEIAAGLDTPAATRLAGFADRAAFAPEPSPGQGVWPLAKEVRAGLRRRTPWYRRIFWAVDPRPLWRR